MDLVDGEMLCLVGCVPINLSQVGRMASARPGARPRTYEGAKTLAKVSPWYSIRTMDKAATAPAITPAASP